MEKEEKKIIKNPIKVADEKLFAGFKHDELPMEKTAENYVAVLRTLCEKKELWSVGRVNLSNTDNPTLNTVKETKPLAVVVDENSNIRSDILVNEEGTRLFPIFTKQDYAIIYSKHYEKLGTLAIIPITMEKVLKKMGDNIHNATRIIVDLKCDTQLELNEEAIKIIAHIVLQNKEKNEENDEEYKEGRKCADEAKRLYFGTGVKKDKATALQLYEKAAELLQVSAKRGNKKAQYDLALLIRNGHGALQDFEKAASLLRQSVIDGDKHEKKEIEKMIAEFEFYKAKNKK